MLFFLCFGSLTAQDSLNFFKPNLLSNHPLGIFISRINHNFNYQPAKKGLSFTLSRGNVWLPKASSYLPNDAEVRAQFENMAWHYRPAEFRYRNITDYKSREIEVDGILSTYFLSFNSPLNKKFDFYSNIRFSSLTEGNIPYSLLTSDELIEWFHSNIAGGDDAFGRKNQPFGNAFFYYKDVNNNEITINNKSFLMSEISNYINYYPRWFTKSFNVNISALTGLSLTNKTWNFDVGASATIIKCFQFEKNRLDWGGAAGMMFPSVFQDQSVIISNVNSLFSLESHWNYVVVRKSGEWVVGTNFHMQSSYHSMKEREYHTIMRREITSHDHMGVSHLTRWLQGWCLVFGRNWKSWSVNCFIREDLWVDNAPDVQVGWGFHYKL